MSTQTRPPQPPSPSTAPLLVRFYYPSLHASDPYNRTLPTLLSWPDSALESSHNYIQILFPLPEYSPINPSAPVIDQETFTQFRSNPLLRQQLRLAFARMLAFYGLVASTTATSSSTSNSDGNDDLYTIGPSPNFPVRARNWVTSMNHNHLRITRIIRSLRVLGCQADAEAFYRALKGVCEKTGRISNRSLGFWTRAARRALNVPPEDERDVGQGRGWLKGLGDLVGEEVAGRVIVVNGDGEGGARFRREDGGG